MDALELTMKCSKLLKKPYSTSSMINDESSGNNNNNNSILIPSNTSLSSSGNVNSGESPYLNTSFSDTDFDLSRLTPKEGRHDSSLNFTEQNEIRLVLFFFHQLKMIE